jgi:type I restriction enzyme S subunit
LHPPGTVLIAMIGQGKTRGQSAILKIAACTNQNSASVVIDHGLIVPEFLWMVFLARYSESREAAKGGNQPALNGETIGRIPLRLPPLAEQAAIVAQVEALRTTCRLLAAEIAHTRAHAAHLLQAVLKQAFTPAAQPRANSKQAKDSEPEPISAPTASNMASP